MTAQYGPKFWPLKYPDHFGSYFFETPFYQLVSIAGFPLQEVWFGRSQGVHGQGSTKLLRIDQLTKCCHSIMMLLIFDIHFTLRGIFFNVHQLISIISKYMTQNIDGATKCLTWPSKVFMERMRSNLTLGTFNDPQDIQSPPAPQTNQQGKHATIHEPIQSTYFPLSSRRMNNARDNSIDILEWS